MFYLLRKEGSLQWPRESSASIMAVSICIYIYTSIYRYMYIDLRARRHLLERDPCELHRAIHA